MSSDDPRHGTESGVWMHRATQTPNCDACREWKARYERGRLNDTIMGRPRLIPALGTVRRLQGLQRLGWPMEEIARRGGWKGRDSLLWMIRQSRFVTRSNAERIDRIYRDLCMTIGPSDITRRRAERAGYAPPLAWDNIDDPNETPSDWQYRPRKIQLAEDFDPVVVMRLLEGDRVPSTAAERAEALARWVADGGTEAELCRWHGWKAGRYGSLRLVDEGVA